MFATCSVDDCDGVAHSMGWCQGHYKRFHATGNIGSTPIQKRGTVGCLVDGCEKKHCSKGYCQGHYLNWKKHGTPTVNNPPSEKGASVAWIAEQLTARSRDNCWTDWPFKSKKRGRPMCSFRGVVGPATHAALLLDGKPRPLAPNDCALHSCDVGECLNPAHLRWGSKADNIADMMIRDRCGTTKLTAEQVKVVRRSYTGKRGDMARLAREIGVDDSAIERAIKRKTWKHVT